MGLLALALTLAVVTGCGDDDDAAGPDDETTTTEAPDTTLSPEADVEAAYLAYWEMAVRLARAPNPDDPEIPERASGLAHANLVQGLVTLKSTNQRTEPGDLYDHEVLSTVVTGDIATLEDCAVDESRLIDGSNGETLDEGVTTTHWSVTLLTDGANWRVDRFERVNAWEGAVECG